MRAAISLLPNLLAETACLNDRRLNAYLNWVLITLTDYDSCALKHLLPSPFHSSSAAPVTDTSLATTNLLSFLRLLHAHAPLNHSAPWPPSSTRRNLAFRDPCPLYALLRPCQHPAASIEDANALLACQIHLCAILLQLSGSEAATNTFLKSLTLQVVEHDLDVHPAIQPLLWLLLYHAPLASSPTAQTLAIPQRPSTASRTSSPPPSAPASYDSASTSLFTSQSVNVLKRVGEPWRQSVGRLCVDWLGGRDGWDQDDGGDGFEAWMDGLRREIGAVGAGGALGGI